MKNVMGNNDFESLRVKAVEEVVRKMDLMLEIERANKESKNADKTWLNKINKKIAELESTNEECSTKSIRRYTNSAIFEQVNKQGKIMNNGSKLENNNKVRDEFVDNLIKKIDAKIEEIERKEKERKLADNNKVRDEFVDNLIKKIDVKIEEIERKEKERKLADNNKVRDEFINNLVKKIDAKIEEIEKKEKKEKELANNKARDEFINNLVKKIDAKIEEIEKKEKENKCSIHCCNISQFDEDKESQKCIKVVSKKSDLSNSEKRAIVFKKWDDLEIEEKRVNGKIDELKKQLKDISFRKSKVIDELSKIIDDRISELEQEAETSEDTKPNKLKKNISNKTLKSSESLKNMELLRQSVAEILAIDDLRAYRNKHLEEHRNRISTIVYSFSYIKREDAESDLYDEAKELVMSIAKKHKTHYSWCKNLIDYAI